MKKIKSKESSFLEYIKKLSPLHGVIGTRDKYENGKIIKGCRKFMIIDHNLKVVFENEPFDKTGNYNKKVKAKLNEFNIKERSNSKDSWDRSRTDDSIEIMIYSLELSHSLDWSTFRYTNEKTEDGFPIILPLESFNIEKSSDEFIEFEKVCNYMRFAKHSSDSSYDFEIEYSGYTELGKKLIDETIIWFQNNKSTTPIQDAWFKVLEKNGVKVDWKPYSKGCELPVMKPISYLSLEELDAKREKEMEERRKNITPEQRNELKKLRDKLAS